MRGRADTLGVMPRVQTACTTRTAILQGCAVVPCNFLCVSCQFYSFLRVKCEALHHEFSRCIIRALRLSRHTSVIFRPSVVSSFRCCFVLRPSSSVLRPSPSVLRLRPTSSVLLRPSVLRPSVLHPSSFILHPSSFILRSFTLHPSSFILHPSPFTLHPSSFILRPSSFVLRPLSFILHPSSFVLRPSSSLFILHPSSFILHPSSFFV